MVITELQKILILGKHLIIYHSFQKVKGGNTDTQTHTYI